MGSVWRARDLTLDADVAVKLIDPRFADSPERMARFRREARAAAAIRSSYVVQILDYGVEDEMPFIAMELLCGESLAARLKRAHRLAPDFTSQLLAQVGRALSLAHERGIVHRDIKPDNIFLIREGSEEIGKVLDFGIARQSTGEIAELKTATDAVLGTPFYMSPEQASGEPVDARSDIWSFAVVACECLTGQRPFNAPTLGRLFHAICLADLPLPSSLGSVPAGFDAWFARAAARAKEHRYSSIEEAVEELKAVCGAQRGSIHSSTSAQPSVSPQPIAEDKQRPWSTMTDAGSPASRFGEAHVDTAQNIRKQLSTPRQLEGTTPPTSHSLIKAPSSSRRAAVLGGFILLATSGGLYLRLRPHPPHAIAPGPSGMSQPTPAAALAPTSATVPSISTAIAANIPRAESPSQAPALALPEPSSAPPTGRAPAPPSASAPTPKPVHTASNLPGPRVQEKKPAPINASGI